MAVSMYRINGCNTDERVIITDQNVAVQSFDLVSYRSFMGLKCAFAFKFKYTVIFA